MAIGTHDAQRGVQLSMHCGATAALNLESDKPAFPKPDECRDRTVKDCVWIHHLPPLHVPEDLNRPRRLALEPYLALERTNRSGASILRPITFPFIGSRKALRGNLTAYSYPYPLDL
jgi:hypothetical protein